MAKKSQRHLARYERDQSGCMWGLISMFDFRHGRTTQKLLADRRRASRRAVGVGIPKDKLDLLTVSDGHCQGLVDGKESTTATAGVSKPSVKKLMEEEMVSEQGAKKEEDNSEMGPKHSSSDHGGQQKKNRKKTNRSRSKSCDIHIEDLDVAEKLKSEQLCLQKPEKRSTKSLDIDQIMEEFCHQIHQKSVSCVKHDQHDEIHDQPNQKNPDFEEKLSEAIKLLVNQELINGKNATEDGNIHPSKELADALQILSSHEELFLKLLHGPQSDVVKDENSSAPVGTNLPMQEIDDLRQSDAVIQGKERRFFRRKAKSRDKSTSKGTNSSQESNRIVILKPGPTSLKNHENEGSFCSSPNSQFVVRSKGPNERVGSHFFLSEIKRKLKNAMGKERQEMSTYSASNRFTNKHLAVGDSNKGFKENIGRKSPSKEHFFMEKIARTPVGVKKEEKTGKLKECEIRAEHQTVDYPKQRLLNIYIEAKKHLSEMLSDGTGDMDFSSRHIPKSLGRILSLPEYNSTPTGSPGRDFAQSFVTSQLRSSSDKSQNNNVSHLGGTKLNVEAQSQVSEEVTGNEAQSPANKLVCDNEEDKTFCSTVHEITSEGEVENVEVTEIVIQEDSNIFNLLFEPSNSPNTRDDRNGVVSEVCDEKGYSEYLENELFEQNQPPPSPLASPSKKDGDLEVATEMLGRPSPVSVLEPIFTEENISPASARFQPVEPPVQPLKIVFEEHAPSVADQGIHLKSSIGGIESIFEYVKAVLQSSGMKWDDFYMRAHSSVQLLDSSIFDEVEFFPNQLFCDNKLLFDLINEVLIEVYGHYFGCFPALLCVKPTIRPVPDMKNAVSEVWDGVYWYLCPLPLPHTLDQIVNKDMSKTGTWMDLRYDADALIAEIGDAIFGDMMEETVASCTNEIS